jgi:hypothetical protein
VSRVESNLLNLGKVVLDILIQEELSNLAEGELLLGPDVGQVEDVNLLLLPKVLGLLGSHGLNHDIPSRELAVLNGVVQILLVSVGGIVGRLLLGDETSTLLGLEVNLGVDPLALLVDKLHRVTKVAVHLAPILGDTTVTHKDHDLVDGLGVLRKVIPEHGRVVGVGQVGGGITLLCVDKERELGGVSKEEDGRVVGDDIPVALVRAELDGKPARISGTIVRARLATDSGESDTDGALLAGLEDVGHAEVIERVGGLVESMGTTTLCVNDTLRDTLTIKVRDEVNQVVVLQEKRTVLSNTLDLVGVGHRRAIARRVESVLGLCVSVVVVVTVKVTVLLAVGGVSLE